MRHRPGAAVLSIVVLAWWAPAEADELDEIRALGAEQRYAEALESLEAHLEDNPRDVEARLYKGVVLTRQGRAEEAIEVFDELSREQPQLPEPLNNMAVLHAAQGRYEQAREALMKAIEIEPNYDTAHENLGDVYAKLASLAYERAYALNETNEGAREKAQWMVRVLDTGMPVTKEMGTHGDARRPEVASAPGTDSGTCYTIDGLVDEDAAQALVSWLRSQGAAATVRTREAREVSTYTVYLPAAPSVEAATKLVGKLQDDGFVDIMLIRTGDLAKAVSAGVYRDLGNAERRVAKLRELGYDAALKRNYTRSVNHRIEVSAKDELEVRSRFTESFPEYRLNTAPCSGI